MKRPAFFDTNIFLYADDKAAPKKQNQAIKLVSGHRIQGLAIVSLQVMQEYFVIATRKLDTPRRAGGLMSGTASKAVTC